MSLPKKIYTLDEANECLPYLSTLVDQYRVRFDSFHKLKAEIFELEEENESTESEEISAFQFFNETLKKKITEKKKLHSIAYKGLKQILEDFFEYDIVIQDPYLGLVDFVGIINEERVYLCWKYGEVSINHWHTFDEGFSGRKPLNTDS